MCLKAFLFEVLLIKIFFLKTFLRDLFNSCLKGTTTSDFFSTFYKCYNFVKYLIILKNIF